MSPTDAALELVEETSLSEEDILNYLVAMGVNSSYRKYDPEGKEMYSSYLNLPLKTISKSWERLDSQVKLAVIDANQELFLNWINGGEYAE